VGTGYLKTKEQIDVSQAIYPLTTVLCLS